MTATPLRWRARFARGWATFSWAHRLWLLATFLLSFLFMVLIPPFQTNDEPAHWHRVWTVARGQVVCGEIPKIVDSVLPAADYAAIREHRHLFRFALWDAMRAIRGVNGTITTSGGACAYIPVAHVLPGLAMLPFVTPFDSRGPAGMAMAFYAARAANLLLMAFAVLLFVVFVPQVRNLALVVYSFPTVMQQTIAINQESFTFLCLFWLIAAYLKPPRRGSVATMLVAATLMSAMKVTFLLLLGFWAAGLLRWRREEALPLRRLAVNASLLFVPILLHLVWWKAGAGVTNANFPSGVVPSQQLDFLVHNPGRFFTMMLSGHADLFGRGHMNGGWTGVLGVLGWADFEIGDRAYVLLFFAIAIAVVCDLANDEPIVPLQRGDRRERWLRWLAPLASAYVIIPSVIFAMYVSFSPIGAPYAQGVQGRYLIFSYVLMIVVGLDWARVRGRTRLVSKIPLRVRGALPWLAMVLCVGAGFDAIEAILRVYHLTPP